ncbi:MAG: hypothetical protein JXA13_01625 [Anaerolineales bacterium]|nr:hypothetical protein [Anaerolineales bacterium]
MENKDNRSLATLLVGAMLVGFGLLSFTGQVFSGFHFWRYTWPFTIIGFGLLFFVGMLAGGKSTGALAIPGSIITTIGGMLFYQNLSGHWESWAYGWTVILMSVGAGILIMGVYQDKGEARQSGLKVIKLGLILFVIFGAFFELIFSTFSPFGLRQYFFPLLLIAVGMYMILVRSGLLPVGKKASLPQGEEPVQES